DGLADSGAFKAANYTLESTEDATASGLIAGAAGKPVSVAAARGTNATTATVSWAAPESTGVPNGEIGKYHIRWRSVAVEADAAAGIAAAAAGAWQNAVGESDLGEDVGTETTVIVQGLLPSRGYEMQVVAENEFGAAGRGEYSDSAVAVGIPPKPVITAVTPNGAKQFSIAFTAPLVAAGGETTPVYAWRPLGVDHTGNEWVVPQNVVPNTSRVQNVSPGLTSNDEIQYEVRMALRNAFGTGAWSKSRFVTPPSGNPAAPPAWSRSRGIRELTAYSHGGPNIDVRWSPPPTINLSRQVGRYEVRWKLASATTFAATDKHTLQADGRNTRDGRNAYVIRNLETGVYNVDVRACNDTGCNTWHNARDPGNGAGISTGHGLGNTDNVDAIQEMIVPLVEALEIGDRSLTVNWRPPLYADGSVIDYGFPVTTYRARWRPAIGTNREYLNPLGAAGEVVLNTDPESNARRSYTISGLRNGTHYQVEFWSERQRGTEAGQAKVDAYLNASGKSWTERITQMRAAGSPLENAVFVPRVRVIGAPRGEQPNAIPTLNDLALGEQRLTIAATWSAPTASVSGYQARWRPVVSGANQQTWQVADVAGTSYTITEYTRDDNARGALREIQYEVQVRSRNALGGNAWSQWSASKRITPLSPTLRGIRITGAGEAGVAEVALQSVPPFAVATLSYAVEVPNTANAVHFTPIVSPGRSITIGLAGTRNPPAVAGGARSAAFALEPGASARVEVTVTATAGGLSANSVYVYVLTRAGDPPGPPSGVSANPGTFDLEVSWGAPAASGGDANYSEYRVRWRTVGTPASGRTPGTPPGAWQPNAEGRKVGLAGQTVIRGLTPGTVYEAQVRAVNSRGLAGQWSAPVSDSPRSFTFDVDESGTSDITDGILVGRYLIGLRGAAVTDGQTLPEGMTTGKINGNISVGVRDNRFDVDRDGRSTAQDGIMIMRYSFGVTSGSGLTAGQTNEDAENVAGAIEALQQ
ncbi:MAG: fibronectin type III domain-containing protein, partial [Gammaproteobacteria bacterium]|nr:fibronectin type III domain-containing protein [Gammaproteobacteria bacterium]